MTPTINHPRRSTEWSLRAGKTADAVAIARIWDEGWTDAHAAHVPEELLAARTAASFERRAAERVSEATVALSRDDVVGFVMVVGDEIEQVYVDRGARGTGVAGALLAEAERLVASGGHVQAWLAVATGNVRARRFYERQGWTDEGAFDYAVQNGEQSISVPCHRYVKTVPDPRRRYGGPRGGQVECVDPR